jgi:uncharacterized GH25 family protein
MKTNHRKHLLPGLILLSILICQTAWAHDLWITMDADQVNKGGSGTAAVFSSHHFPAPASDYLAPERADKIFFITPGGRQVTATQAKDGTFEPQSALKEKGTYVAVALPVNGFFTKTPEGYQLGKSKKDVTSPLQCRFSQKYAKAIFARGNGGGSAFSKPLGHAMEIVPMKDPVSLKTGDILPVKVLLEGKPARTYIYGTYAGFSESANTFAYTTRTDKEGIAQIRIIHDGDWLLIAKQEEAYPDAAECDLKSWAASLTFEIQ